MHFSHAWHFDMRNIDMFCVCIHGSVLERAEHMVITKMHSYIVGASPTLVGRPHNFGVVDHVQTTTDKTGRLTIGFPCRGEIHGVDYCTSLFGLSQEFLS